LLVPGGGNSNTNNGGSSSSSSSGGGILIPIMEEAVLQVLVEVGILILTLE